MASLSWASVLAGLELGHDRIGPESLLGVAQLQARLRQHQMRRDELRIDLHGVLELDLGALVLALVEVLLALGEMRLLLLLLGGAAGKSNRATPANATKNHENSVAYESPH